MKKPEPIPPEILRDARSEVIGLWRDFRAALAGNCADPDLVAAILTQAAITRINGLYPMHEVHIDPARDPVITADWGKWKRP